MNVKPTATPLETFLQSYTEAVGGVWEEVEPQVYDVLLPDAPDSTRLAFDSDALDEHPTAQFFTFGSAVMEDFLEKATAHGNIAEAYINTAHLPSQGAAYWLQRLKRELTVPEGAEIRLLSLRPMNVLHLVCWFEVTFLSDEKEQALYSAAVDRHYGRQVRYLDTVLHDGTMESIRRTLYPAAKTISIEEAYLLTRERVLRTLGADVNTRRSDMEGRLQRQTRRISNYFEDLRDELRARIEKAQHKIELLHAPPPDEKKIRRKAAPNLALQITAAQKPLTKAQQKAAEKAAADAEAAQAVSATARAAQEAELREEIRSLEERVATLNREEAVRLDDVRKKSVLRVSMRLTNYLHVHIPRLFFALEIVPVPARGGMTLPALPLTMTFDGMMERFDAAPCPNCGKPTYSLLLQTIAQKSLWCCSACANSSQNGTAQTHKKR
jgi:hypothetical protein